MQKTYCDKCSKEILPCQQTYYALVPGLEIDKENMKTQYCGQDVKHVELCESCVKSLMEVVDKDTISKAKAFDQVASAIHVERNTDNIDAKNDKGVTLVRMIHATDNITIDGKTLLRAVGYNTIGCDMCDINISIEL